MAPLIFYLTLLTFIFGENLSQGPIVKSTLSEIEDLEPFALPALQLVFGAPHKNFKTSWAKEEAFFEIFFQKGPYFNQWIQLGRLRGDEQREIR